MKCPDKQIYCDRNPTNHQHTQWVKKDAQKAHHYIQFQKTEKQQNKTKDPEYLWKKKNQVMYEITKIRTALNFLIELDSRVTSFEF